VIFTIFKRISEDGHCLMKHFEKKQYFIATISTNLVTSNHISSQHIYIFIQISFSVYSLHPNKSSFCKYFHLKFL